MATISNKFEIHLKDTDSLYSFAVLTKMKPFEDWVKGIDKRCHDNGIQPHVELQEFDRLVRTLGIEPKDFDSYTEFLSGIHKALQEVKSIKVKSESLSSNFNEITLS